MAKILTSPIEYKGPPTENLVEFIRDGLRRHSSQTILIDSKSDQRWTGRELERQVSIVARYLIEECHLSKGDVCTIYCEPNDFAVIIILAIISAGGVENFLTNKYRPREVFETSKVIKAKYLISTNLLLQEVKQHVASIDELHVISCDAICEGFKNGCKTIEPVLMKSSPDTESDRDFDGLVERVDIDPERDISVIQFSSGTTGIPKPIPRTHKNLCHLVASVEHSELMDLRPGQVIAGSLALTHRTGLWALLACISGGGTLVLWSDMLGVEDALRVVDKYKITIFSTSLPFLAMLGNVGIHLKDKFDLSSLQHIITAGAKIVHSGLPESIVKEFKLKSLRQCFGMTEAGWVFLIESSQAQDNYLTVGHACPSMQVMIMDRDTHKPVGMEVRGELALKGPQIFPGYLTSEPNVFNRSDFTEDGWFRTGDQGFYDARELVFIEGRYKELLDFFICGSCSRFFPNEIEAVINEHPAIEGSCVVKISEIKKPYTSDIARAYVTLKQGIQTSEKELLDFVADQSSEIILEGGIRILDKFPRLQNGKVDKQALRGIQ